MRSPRPPGGQRTGDEPVRHRIGSSSEDNGEGPRRLLGGQGLGCASGQEEINLERNQFGRKSGEPLELPLGISVFNDDVATLDVTEVTQSLTEGLFQVGIRGQVERQEAYSSDLGRLLRIGAARAPASEVSRKRRRSTTRSPDPPAAAGSAESSVQAPSQS